METCAAIVLAAGEGKRMRSSTPKVLHPIAHLPMLGHVLRALTSLPLGKIVVVLGPDREDVASFVSPHTVVIQNTRQGTGDAARSACSVLDGFERCLIVYGDVPLVRPSTLDSLMRTQREKGTALLSFTPPDPEGYGRLLFDENGYVERIIESKECSPEQAPLNQCYSGLMAVSVPLLKQALGCLTNHNAQGEYYLTDVVAHIRSEGHPVFTVQAEADEVVGVNTRAHLAYAEALWQNRARCEVMDQGVTLMDPESVWLAYDTSLAQDVVVEPCVFFGPGVSVESKARVRGFSHLEGVRIGAGASVGPFARLRPESFVDSGARVGNFVELKNTHLKAGAKVGHLSYMGDACVGEEANVGAGVICCNYDGVKKWPTHIEEKAFIGSNCSLVAPLTVGASARVGAGSTLTKDVPSHALALARSRQINKLKKAK